MVLLALGSNRLCIQSSTSPYPEHLLGATTPAVGRTAQPVPDTHSIILKNPHVPQFLIYEFQVGILVFSLYFIQFRSLLLFPLYVNFYLFPSSFSTVCKQIASKLPFLSFYLSDFALFILISFVFLSLIRIYT